MTMQGQSTEEDEVWAENQEIVSEIKRIKAHSSDLASFQSRVMEACGVGIRSNSDQVIRQIKEMYDAI